MGEVHEHPTWKQYKWVALILTLITVVEVWIYYTPFKDSPLFVPVLLIMSAVKFAIVVLFYMHLKYDHKLFKGCSRAADHRDVHAHRAAVPVRPSQNRLRMAPR